MEKGYCNECLGPVSETGFCKKCNDEDIKILFEKLGIEPTEKIKSTIDFDNIENSINGYKYVLEFSFSINDPLDTSNSDRICICDTRDECIEEIKKDIARYQEANARDGFSVFHEEYNITRLGTIIKWYETKEGKSWFYSYNIYPVRYFGELNNKEEWKKTMLKAFDLFHEAGMFKDDLCFDQEHWIETVMWERFNKNK